jgi:hypothetical protein
MALTVRNTKLDKPPPLRMCVYGASGSGKTTLAGTFPKPFFFCMGAEVGISSLNQLDYASDYVLINTDEDMLEAVTMFKNEYKQHGWRTAVIDTATVYARYCTMQESAYGTKSMEFTNWMHILGKFLNIRDVVHQCDVHVVWVLHMDEIKSGDIVLRYGPKLPGQAKGEIIQTCGLLCYLDKIEKSEVKDEKGVIVTPAATIRRLWVKCPEGTSPAFETKSWYEQVLTAPCYTPSFERLARELAPKEGKQHITV